MDQIYYSSCLVIGAGDGGVVREVLKHQSVEKVVHCEIDQVVMGSLVLKIRYSSEMIYSTIYWYNQAKKMSVKNLFHQCLPAGMIPVWR